MLRRTVLLVVALSAALAPSLSARIETKFSIYTTFYPTTYFAKRIAGEVATVTCPLPPDADPAFWIPDRDALAKYQKADLIVVNGAEFEKWVGQATLSASRTVDTSKPFAKDFIVIEKALTHSHGKEGPHSHQGTNGHTWLDPVNAKAQAGEIAKALVKKLGAKDPDAPETKARIAAIEKNAAALAKDLDALDASWRGLGKQKDGEVFIASHPAYDYLCRRYGWRVQSFGLDPETMPTEEELAPIRAAIAATPARFMLWEETPKAEIRDKVKNELHLDSITIVPGENPSAEELAKGVDFLAIQKANVEALRPCLEPAK